MDIFDCNTSLRMTIIFSPFVPVALIQIYYDIHTFVFDSDDDVDDYDNDSKFGRILYANAIDKEGVMRIISCISFPFELIYCSFV